MTLTQWDPDFRLTNHSFIDRTDPSSSQNIVTDSQGNIHVVWSAYLPRWRIYYRRYNGSIWLPETLLVTGVDVIRSQFSSLAVDTNNNLHLIFEDERYIRGFRWHGIFYKKWNGSVWSPDTNLTDSLPYQYPSFSVDSTNKIYVVWSQHGYPGRLFYKRFNGLGWEKDTVLAYLKSDVERFWAKPVIAVDLSGYLHLFWSDDTTGNYEIYYKCYNGSFWEPETMLTNAFESSIAPSVVCDSRNRLHLVWLDFRLGTWDIFYKRFNGTAWEPETLLVGVDYIKEHPFLAVDKQDRLHLVWSDYRHGESEIYYKCYNGTNWGPDVRITNAPGHSTDPFICVDDSNRLHFLWTDRRDGGNEEIYYKRLNITKIKEDGRLQIAERELKIKQNPTRRALGVKLLASGSENLKIYDITGKLVKDLTKEAKPGLWLTVSLNPGIYFVTQVINNATITKKVIIVE